jgi:hypothetical protein
MSRNEKAKGTRKLTIGGHAGTVMPSEYFGENSGRYVSDPMPTVYTPGNIQNGLPVTYPAVTGGAKKAAAKPKAKPKTELKAKAKKGGAGGKDMISGIVHATVNTTNKIGDFINTKISDMKKK